ncbi:SufD family Fe-S cluster assembly protein [Novosphingobium album (ex Liu et al. 2023)]|uniref:SufD family Fe-S cluster assembly protein n=1 Tax=Novosphingobium album (ex Liu et al. 2023) TaxID=3031130 RepID=A0ABT5WNU8_9SPHN|nr:SufD family Fe-S cluster assembly protein [Novosphingobium album (ex Liu et al. 2023)]MDE8651726.1 SufD family Fe-S cluster assembly protein [Novosphingobium album (ex Liu et al. 2023)]
MSEALVLPTRRDEDWRYADAAFLAASDPATLMQWSEWTIAPGETRRDYRVLASGALAGGTVERLRVHVGAGGRFELGLVNAAGRYARFEAEVTLAEGAHFEFGGVTIGGGDNVQEVVTRVLHAEPGATSNQIVRAVQWGRATGNFLGRIEVARDAQQTDAGQNFKAILLEAGASANTKPELEIFADDVKCAHGAAIGALDETAGFYLASRGLPPAEARKLLIRAFIADAFAAITDEEARLRLLDEALAVLDGEAP